MDQDRSQVYTGWISDAKAGPMIERKSVRLTALFLAAFLTVGASCTPVKDAMAALKGHTDEATNLLTRPADPAEFSALSSRLKGTIKEVPDNASLTQAEKQQFENSAQTADVLQEIAEIFELADNIKALISKDSVLLVGGSFRQNPSDEFAAMLEKAAQNILKDTACSMFYDEMNAVSPMPASTVPGTGFSGPATENTVYRALTQAIDDANFIISSAKEVVDLTGLSNQMLSTASGYVGKVKKAVTATAWNNGGATRAYLQVCVFSK